MLMAILIEDPEKMGANYNVIYRYLTYINPSSPESLLVFHLRKLSNAIAG